MARCPRCDQPLCAEHQVTSGAVVCLECERAIETRLARRMPGRIAVAVGAGVGGMIGGEVAMLLLGALLGLGAEITILLVLVAALGMGGLSAYSADRFRQHWLKRQALLELGTLPEARLIERRADHE